MIDVCGTAPNGTVSTGDHDFRMRPRGKSRGGRKKELVRGEYLFWQAELLAEGLQPSIAANQIEFWIREVSTEPHGSKYSHALQRIESTLFVAQAGESQSLRIRTLISGCELFGLVTAASPAIGVAEEALNVGTVGTLFNTVH